MDLRKLKTSGESTSTSLRLLSAHQELPPRSNPRAVQTLSIYAVSRLMRFIYDTTMTTFRPLRPLESRPNSTHTRWQIDATDCGIIQYLTHSFSNCSKTRHLWLAATRNNILNVPEADFILSIFVLFLFNRRYLPSIPLPFHAPYTVNSHHNRLTPIRFIINVRCLLPTTHYRN